VVNAITVSPYWWILQGSTHYENAILWVASNGAILTTWTFGRGWLRRTPLALDSAPAGVVSTDLDYVAVDVYGSPTDIDRVMVAAGRVQDSGTWHSWLFVSTDRGYTWTSIKLAPGSAETRVLDARLDQESGSVIWVAYQDIDAEELFVGQRNLDGTTIGTDSSFGAATEAEVPGTYKLGLYTRRDSSVADFGDYALAFGEFSA
jgi:hypothetical protein